MSSSCFVILPIHLFDINTLILSLNKQFFLDKQIIVKENTLTDIYIIEEPIYFGDRDVKLNFNKLKLIYHRASTKYYNDYLQSNNNIKKLNELFKTQSNIKISYLNYDELKKKSNYNSINKHSHIYMFDPVDTYLDTKYVKLFKSKLKYLETPLFLCSNKDLEDYHKSKPNSNSYTHASFYKWQKSRLHILEQEKTYDTENRNKMPIDTKIPPLPKNDAKTKEGRPYLIEAINYVDKYFPSNLEPLYVSSVLSGSSSQKTIQPESIHFPITHKSSILWLEHFCKNRLENFGEYEDSIDSIPRNFLFHSTISPMLNIGLITPDQVIAIVSNYYTKHKNITLATYEGFIRQVIGWREYQRYIYKYIGNKMRSSNHFNNDRKLTEHWYNATTTIKPVDDAIMMAINDGYIHHILRLMVVGNFMNLVGIHPDEVYKWFMEFAVDSYDWVMIGNVYSMTLWADGGLTMRKPYISGDGYIMNMGNYKKKAEWNTLWNNVFHHFIDRNTNQLSKTYYNGIVKAWVRKPISERNKELTIANEFIKHISN
jgi:deoxyribodipyrimidine photolyase-related protein